MKKIMLILGTRPEAIKMCPLIAELRARGSAKISVCASGQHKEMLCDVLDAFGVRPDHELSIMKKGQTLSKITYKATEGLSNMLLLERPDLVLVHGDTATAFCGALAAFYAKIDVGHVEAGLRTYNLYSPYPEEFNRRAISLIAKYHFAPTESAKQNLLREGIDKKSVFVTGNTAIDALRTTVRKNYSHPALQNADNRRIIMLTMHRRENIGAPMKNVFRALYRITEEYPDTCVIYPMHPNPEVREIARAELGKSKSVYLSEPLGVLDFHNILARSYIAVTDSGGIQEEAPHLNKPVLVARDTTERPEGIQAGTAKLIGCEAQNVYQSIKRLLDDPVLYTKMSQAQNPYGDGFASARIANVLLDC